MADIMANFKLNFTLIPAWVLSDILVYIGAALLIFYIIKKEERPVTVLMEFICFVFFYAAVYENFATLVHFYGYGRSLIMVFNVPLSVPVIEFMILYSGLKLLDTMRVPAWTKPILAGFFAIIADFSMDPVSVKMIFETLEGTIGRWTWYPHPGEPVIYGEPVLNFSGWMYITGYAAAFFMLGRQWHKKSNYSPAVGCAYPFAAVIASLLVLISPITRFLMMLDPIMAPYSNGQWIMLIVALAVPVLLLAFVWRGRMTGALSVKADFPVFLTMLGYPVINIISCVIGGYWQVLWLVALAGAAMWTLVGGIYALGRGHVMPAIH
ncbi:Protein of unknown function [Sporobacter termitidis DSM 10068]|uniref:Carotenoid biosynthesis protein n=1 Tax=Sporobacter termitidis DSM 10068 TaxID=1123282 RepID=A0A1M5WF98_9FIRM|nr:carotenoid biosynthesis protein [Sporobacter termitidis]SHH86185.1 Protein of unknown function [Sporobacter termitidis DSM 10068]